MQFEQEVQRICDQAIKALTRKNLSFRPMQRRRPLSYKRSFVIGRTNLRTGSISIDIFTPRKREPKKISSILKTLCHEVAHHQKPPYRQFFRFRWINRQHFPAFYKQVESNIESLKSSERFSDFFKK